MAYSDFSMLELKTKFNVALEEADLFSGAPEIQISERLAEDLSDNIPLAIAIHTEKARSEFIIAPILANLRRMLHHQISLFSGIDFNVDKEKGLTGICDYIISLSKDQYDLEAPIVSVVEAKNDNIKAGIPQCIAEMLAARLFNKNRANDIESVYGIVTNGTNWRFLKLNEKLYIEEKEYYIDQINKVMGILKSIVTPCQQPESKN